MPGRQRLRSEQYQTYGIKRPPGSHWRPATCGEVDCQPHAHGWRLRVEGLTPEDVHAARTSGRSFVEQHVGPGETWLVFEAGQPCFRASQHRAPLEREPLYVVRGGDARGNPLRRHYLHSTADSWVDDFATNQDRLNTAAQRG